MDNVQVHFELGGLFQLMIRHETLRTHARPSPQRHEDLEGPRRSELDKMYALDVDIWSPKNDPHLPPSWEPVQLACEK